MKLADFKLTAKDFGTFGEDLQRPECVWIDADGVWASDARGGVAHVPPEGKPRVLGTGMAEPNGFSRRPDGSFVVASLDDSRVCVIAPDGKTRTIADKIDGKPLGTVNYACADGNDRTWVAIMTRAVPWHAALTTTKIDGYIVRIDGDGERVEIVADGLDLTNEVKISPDGRHLYAVETLGCRIVRFPLLPNGKLGARETVGPSSLGRGAFPDGITFDRFGNLWITIITQNALFVIDTRGDLHIVYRDMNEQAVATIAEGNEKKTGTLEQLGVCAAVDGPVRLPTSIAFRGRTAFIGNVGLTHLPTFQLPAELT
jgi:sugar lactone lactonase YvrE